MHRTPSRRICSQLSLLRVRHLVLLTRLQHTIIAQRTFNAKQNSTTKLFRPPPSKRSILAPNNVSRYLAEHEDNSRRASFIPGTGDIWNCKCVPSHHIWNRSFVLLHAETLCCKCILSGDVAESIRFRGIQAHRRRRRRLRRQPFSQDEDGSEDHAQNAVDNVFGRPPRMEYLCRGILAQLHLRLMST